MTVVSAEKDPENLAFTVVAEFDSPVREVWELWSDPRKLERWWGPPGYPAKVERHDLTPGGMVLYSMTGPDLDVHHGVWAVRAVDPPGALDFIDSFAEADGTPIAEMPTTSVSVRLTEAAAGARMEIRSTFESLADMERWVDTGTPEGMRQAVAQMDAILSA